MSWYYILGAVVLYSSGFILGGWIPGTAVDTRHSPSMLGGVPPRAVLVGGLRGRLRRRVAPSVPPL